MEENKKIMPVFSWTVLPAKKNILKTALFLTTFGIIIFLIQYSFQTPFFTILAGLILGGSFVQFFIPTRYDVFEDKIRITRLFNTAEKELKFYRRIIIDKNGFFLSPFSTPNRLDPFRGVYILLENNKDEVINFVKTRLESK